MTSKKVTVDSILKRIRDEKIVFVDFRFTDSLGKFHHTSYRSTVVKDTELEKGIAFDGSSIMGWKKINDSDTVMKPDLSTAFVDPFSNQPTLVLICDVVDPISGEPYIRDPRTIGKKAEAYVKSSKLGENAYFGPEMEFFIFDDVRFKNCSHEAGFSVNSEEGSYNNNKESEVGNLGHRSGVKAGYFPVQPVDSLNDIRAEMVLAMESVGLKAGIHHHEVAEGQCEIGIEYAPLVESGDNIQKFKYIVKNVAASYGKSATFMPKPIYGDNGSGMHTHQSIWKDGVNLFYKKGKYADLSEICLYYIGGIIKHAKALNAFTNPSTNSYKRLVPGFEAPTLLVYSANNRSAAIRIPYVFSSYGKRIEVRFPDPTANPYLSFAAMLMAGIDGIKNKINPGEAIDKDLYDLSEKEVKKIPVISGSLKESLEALDRNRVFLKQGGVFSDNMIDAYIELKMQEVKEWETRPHPIEYKMYYST